MHKSATTNPDPFQSISVDIYSKTVPVSIKHLKIYIQILFTTSDGATFDSIELTSDEYQDHVCITHIKLTKCQPMIFFYVIYQSYYL